MKYRLSNRASILYLLSDLMALNIAFIAAFGMAHITEHNPAATPLFSLFLFVNFSWMLFMRSSISHPRSDTGSRATLMAFFKIYVLVMPLIWLFNLTFGTGVGPFKLAVYTFSFGLLALLFRLGFKYYQKSAMSKRYQYKKVVAVGINPFSLDFVEQIIYHPECGYKFMGFFDYETSDKGARVGSFDSINQFLIEYDIDEVYVSLPNSSDYRIKELIKFCRLKDIKVCFLNEFIHLLNRKTVQVTMDYNGLAPTVAVEREPLEHVVNQFLKRSFDVVFSLLIMVLVCSWLFPLIAILIKLNSRGPVFFKQMRTGIDNEAFLCYKFRTMTVNQECDSMQATAHDLRITRVGKVLRKTNLDELPQFINVLKGEMSIVGPRPHMLSHTQMYAKLIQPFMVRHWVKPGITGLAQAKGYRGETQEVRQMYNRVRLDVFYIHNWSFSFDLKLIYLTVWNMLTLQKGGA